MAEHTTEKARQTPRDAAAMAKKILERSGGSAQRLSETATGGYEELLTLSRESMDGIARASQVILSGTSELSSVWFSFWSEQLDEGVQALRSLSECRSWHEALAVQNDFTRSSIERVCSRATKSAELMAETVTGSFRPLQECADKAIEHLPRAAA